MPTSQTFHNTISKEELADLPTKEFAGYPVTVINLEQAEIAVRQIRESGMIVGFDTETRPSFQKGVTYRVCLVQLSVGKVCYLFRLNKIKEFPDCLKALLEDANVVKVGLSTQDDFKNLRKWDEELEPKGFIELQQLVKTYGIVDLINCSTAEFTNCRMHDNMDMNMICATQSYGIRFDGCEFYNNYVATEQYSNGSFVYSYDSGEIEMTRCTFRDNNYTDLCNEADKVKTENCRFLN